MVFEENTPRAPAEPACFWRQITDLQKGLSGGAVAGALGALAQRSLCRLRRHLTHVRYAHSYGGRDRAHIAHERRRAAPTTISLTKGHNPLRFLVGVRRSEMVKPVHPSHTQCVICYGFRAQYLLSRTIFLCPLHKCSISRLSDRLTGNTPPTSSPSPPISSAYRISGSMPPYTRAVFRLCGSSGSEIRSALRTRVGWILSARREISEFV
ncbi:hypothetical protein EVAR_63384_1 [Eumeta japonica]|uniref:Uncharacterized protein n=1 Tax=Eumeta variegata TaxID=151549 RepID=A0A4C1YTZ3_EUMVA|nr:hypothetical protein EVAR_63384_1 [Eumeta japonica]